MDTWAAPEGHSGGDWVGVYQPGATVQDYLEYIYVGEGQSGSITVRPPN